MVLPRSDTAFRTISEAAEIIGVPQHVLRFWETRFTELQPLKRGGNRRYYRPDDIDLLRRIRVMLHDQGLTIRGAQLALSETGRGPSVTGRVTVSASLNAMSAPGPVADISRLRSIRDRLRAALAA
jgi:DNA-binding transcriptional MerR regulator